MKVPKYYAWIKQSALYKYLYRLFIQHRESSNRSHKNIRFNYLAGVPVGPKSITFLPVVGQCVRFHWRQLANHFFWMEHDDVIKWIYSTLLAFMIGIHRSPMDSWQTPMTWSFDVFFDLHLKRLRKPSWHRWFDSPSPSLWRHHSEMDEWEAPTLPPDDNDITNATMHLSHALQYTRT